MGSAHLNPTASPLPDGEPEIPSWKHPPALLSDINTDASNLCAIHQTWNLRLHTFQEYPIGADLPPDMGFGTLAEISQRRNCSFCRFIGEVLRVNGGPWDDDKVGCLSCFVRDGQVRIKSLTLELPAMSTTLRVRLLSDVKNRFRPIGVVPLSKPPRKELFFGRMFEPTQIDVALLRS
jgi:hypothetical protein